MTERTTDREALADEAQSGYDAVEAQREATRSVAQRALQAQGDIASMYDEEIADLRADVTRLEGALKTADVAYHEMAETAGTLRGERERLRGLLAQSESEWEAKAERQGARQ